MTMMVSSLDELSRLLAVRHRATMEVCSVGDLIRDPSDPITCEALGIMTRGLIDCGVKKIPEEPEKVAELYLSRLRKEGH